MHLILGYITDYAISSAGAKDTLITLSLAAISTGIIVAMYYGINYLADVTK
jgi:hypothetical protein